MIFEVKERDKHFDLTFYDYNVERTVNIGDIVLLYAQGLNANDTYSIQTIPTTKIDFNTYSYTTDTIGVFKIYLSNARKDVSNIITLNVV